MANGKKPATYEDIEALPVGWVLTATHEGEQPVRAEPFDAVPLALGLLWLERAPATR